MRRFFAFLPVLAACIYLTAGCHAQQTSASKGYNVNLTWNAPTASAGWTGCTTAAPCVYSVWVETLASGSTCDPATATAWKELTTAATRPSATSFVDPGSTGLNRCYAVHTLQNGQDSGPSNSVNIVVPGIPTAPLVNSPTTVQQSEVLQAQPTRNAEVASVTLHAIARGR